MTDTFTPTNYQRAEGDADAHAKEIDRLWKRIGDLEQRLDFHADLANASAQQRLDADARASGQAERVARLGGRVEYLESCDTANVGVINRMGEELRDRGVQIANLTARVEYLETCDRAAINSAHDRVRGLEDRVNDLSQDLDVAYDILIDSLEPIATDGEKSDEGSQYGPDPEFWSRHATLDRWLNGDAVIPPRDPNTNSKGESRVVSTTTYYDDLGAASYTFNLRADGTGETLHH